MTHSGRQLPLDVTDPDDQAGAEAAATKLIDKLAAGIAAKLASPHHPKGDIPEFRNSGTVAGAVASYLTMAERRMIAGKLVPESLANYRGYLHSLRDHFGPLVLDSLTAEQLESWAERPEWSASTQNNALGVVQQLLKVAGISLPIHRPPKESRGADAVLTDEQFAEVLGELRKYKVQADLPELLKVLRETGARPQEIARLWVQGVDWGNACTRLREHKTRRHTGTDRIIHFNSAAMVLLNGQRERYRDGLLFRTRAGNGYSPAAIVRRLGQVSDRVGYRVIAYGLGRHSFATRALEAGVPDVLVAGLLGHRGTAMLHRHYSHVGENARALKDAAERASQRTRRSEPAVDSAAVIGLP